ncbi:MAG: serine/threonine protein kinase [Fibrobacter sp.]|nr:serine/threonine protein kinase [Fibrobacter sp.]
MTKAKNKAPLRIGAFEPIEKIGQGAMGDIWLCYDHSLDRNLIVKQMKVSLRNSKVMEERFNREVRVHAKLQHPNIVGIHSYWRESNTTLNIGMEWVNGWNLEQVLEKCPQPPLWVCLAIIRDILSGLTYAHDRDVIHRDLKPSNIMFGFDGRVRILDFGIAKDSEQDLTQGAGIVGTTSFLSPEQAQSLPLSPASDLFSLGIVVWKMFSGQHPFRHENPEQTVANIIGANPQGKLSNKIPHNLGQWNRRLLAKKTKKRPQNSREVALHIDRALSAYPRDLSPWLANWIYDLRKGDNSKIQVPRASFKRFWLTLFLGFIIGASAYFLWSL